MTKTRFVIKNQSGDLLFIMNGDLQHEHYDVLDHLGRKSGCVQLIDGELSCCYPSATGSVIYSRRMNNQTNAFVNDNQRIDCMAIIAEAIHDKKREIRTANKRKYACMRA